MLSNTFGRNAIAGLAVWMGALIALLFSSASMAHDGDKPGPGLTIAPLMQQALADLAGKEAMMLTVEFAPGFADQPHRHDAHVFVYVLEGKVEFQVKGSPARTLGPGDTFYENPKDIHTVGRNLSDTKPAKILVVLIKNQNAPPVLPASGN